MTRSGSSLPAIQDSANSSCSLLRSLARYAPHSIACSDTLTPTALRLDWMTVDMATGDCMPEPDSGTHSVVVSPASAPHVFGSTGPTDSEPVPLRTSRTIASLLTAKLRAWRTRLSSNGFFWLLIPRYQTCAPTCLTRVILGLLSSWPT